jgi:hypoxanthine phosphoribosyltransferase
MFMADLMRHLKLDLTVEYMEIGSYSGMQSTGRVRVLKDISSSILGKHVIVVEDIVDTGYTLQNLHDHLMAKKPASVKFCILLNNPTRRGEGFREPEYIGFVIPNQFVIGYGLDYDGKYRQLPFVASLVRSAE